MNQDLHDSIRDQAVASRQRLEDAKVLLRASRWRGSMYIAGYAVECLLKTKLMQIYDCKNLRELDDVLLRRSVLPVGSTTFIHQLETLFKLTPSYHRLQQNQDIWSLFNVVNRWVPKWRYVSKQTTRDEASFFMDAVEKVMQWIDNNI
ncbi:MAG: hypothetical protein OXL96_01025 [Candidatus Poribacteria bacterium]|nr:hypothetical protein [Candidatus Poribacteria bacterium]